MADYWQKARLARAMQGMEHKKPAPEQRPFYRDAIDGAAISSGAVPVVGDITGLMSDAFMYAEDPESRNWKNFALTAAAMLPGVPAVAAAKVAKKVGSSARKPVKSVGNLFDPVTDPKQALKMAQQGKHLKRTPDGGYVGAPEQIKSPQQLAAQRKKVDALVHEGAFNMDWYHRARQTAEDFAPHNPEMQSLFARGGAVYSPSSSPDNEIGAFLKQHNAKVLTGEDVKPGMPAPMHNMKRAYQEGGLHPQSIRLGKKTGPYADAKDPTVPEDSLYKTANDIWHGRVMGYGDEFDRGFTPQEHGYLTGENLLLAERAKAADAKAGVQRPTEWSPRAGQAATWGAQRKRQYIADALEAARKKNAKAKNPKPLDQAALEAEAEAYAKTGIDNAANRHSAYITSEARPGAGVGHLPMSNDEQSLIDAYTSLVRTATPREEVLDALGMYSKNAEPTVGYYKNEAGQVERNPGWTNQVLVSSDLSGFPSTMPADRAALDFTTLTGAVLRGQEAGAHSRFFPQGMGKAKVGDMNAVSVNHGAMSPADRASLERAADATGASPINWGDTTLLTQFGDSGPVPGTTGNILKGLSKEDVPGTAVRGVAETGYEPTYLATGGQEDWVGGKTATNYLQRSEAAGKLIPGLENLTAEAISKQAQAMNAIDATISAATGKPQRDALVKMRSILGEGGVPALREYVKKYGTYGLPVVVLGVLGLQQGQQPARSDL